MADVLPSVGSRRVRSPGSQEPGTVDVEGRASAANKRQRVDTLHEQNLEQEFEMQREELIRMDVDVMHTTEAMRHPEPNEEHVPFSPAACSPSRKPWQMRPTPETRPDEHGNLTKKWSPPVSPYGLIEEDQMVFSDPFKLLVVCQLLNKTGATMVRHILYRERFFDRYPSPQALMEADQEALESLLQPLGLWKKRSVGLKRFAREFHELFWDVYSESYKVNAFTRVGDLYGCGEYAVDAVCLESITCSP